MLVITVRSREKVYQLLGSNLVPHKKITRISPMLWWDDDIPKVIQLHIDLPSSSPEAILLKLKFDE